MQLLGEGEAAAFSLQGALDPKIESLTADRQLIEIKCEWLAAPSSST